MTSESARSAGIAVALYFGYQVIAGVALAVTQIGLLVAQREGSSEVALSLFGPLPAAVPYVVAGFVLFWLWPPRSSKNLVVALIARAAVAAAGGALISLVIGVVTATTVSGGWFTSMPREYSFPGWYLGQVPSMLVNGISHNFPVLALAGLVAAVLLRRMLPIGRFQPGESDQSGVLGAGR